MSVFASAIMSHRWREFSDSVIQEIGKAVDVNEVPKWRPSPDKSSPQAEFASYGRVSFDVGCDVILTFGKRSIGILKCDRWSAFLMHRMIRDEFLSICWSVARVTGSREMILLPEDTILEDAHWDVLDLDGLKRRAYELWGPPDLEASELYSEKALNELGHTRVHYMLVQGHENL